MVPRSNGADVSGPYEMNPFVGEVRLVQIAVHVNNQLDFALYNKLKFYIGIPKQRGVEPSQVPLPLQVLALLPSK